MEKNLKIGFNTQASLIWICHFRKIAI
jgi:hypothetical protein